MKKTLIFLDTETTGAEPTDRLCQLAYMTTGQTSADIFNELYKPPVPLSIESMATHHITERMLADKKSFLESTHYHDIKKLLESPDTVLVAHNAAFDIEMLNKEDISPLQWIDTLRLVRHLDPDMKIPRHNLQYLRYYLDLDADIHEPVTAHDAKGDIIVLEKLFNRLFIKMQEKHTSSDADAIIEEMIKISRESTLISKFTFGKHIGKLVKDVAEQDKGYLEWLLVQKQASDKNEEDWIFTLKHFLNK